MAQFEGGNDSAFSRADRLLLVARRRSRAIEGVYPHAPDRLITNPA
jgi:hypothetical protein